MLRIFVSQLLFFQTLQSFFVISNQKPLKTAILIILMLMWMFPSFLLSTQFNLIRLLAKEVCKSVSRVTVSGIYVG